MNIGIDIIEVDRVEKSAKSEAFLKKCFSADELALFESKGYRSDTIAGRFCVKEAFSKALGTGVRNFELSDITTLNDEMGAPYLVLSGNAKKALGNRQASVSISHTKNYATAVVLIY